MRRAYLMAVPKRNASHRLADDPQEIRRPNNLFKQRIIETMRPFDGETAQQRVAGEMTWRDLETAGKDAALRLKRPNQPRTIDAQRRREVSNPGAGRRAPS